MSAELFYELSLLTNLAHGRAEILKAEAQQAERRHLETTIALVQAAGGRIEVSRHDLLHLHDFELLKEVNLDRDSVIYRVRRKAPDGES